MAFEIFEFFLVFNWFYMENDLHVKNDQKLYTMFIIGYSLGSIKIFKICSHIVLFLQAFKFKNVNENYRFR